MRFDDQMAGGDPQEKVCLMAEEFSDRFARLGYSAPHILRLFDDPRHPTAHAMLLVLGEPAIRRIITEAVLRWPAVRILESLENGTD